MRAPRNPQEPAHVSNLLRPAHAGRPVTRSGGARRTGCAGAAQGHGGKPGAGQRHQLRADARRFWQRQLRRLQPQQRGHCADHLGGRRRLGIGLVPGFCRGRAGRDVGHGRSRAAAARRCAHEHLQRRFRRQPLLHLCLDGGAEQRLLRRQRRPDGICALRRGRRPAARQHHGQGRRDLGRRLRGLRRRPTRPSSSAATTTCARRRTEWSISTSPSWPASTA